MEPLKVGSYAIATIQSRPWMSTVNSPAPIQGKPRKSKAQPVIIHQMFSECAQLTDDPLWKAIFENASYGKFPRGFTYRDGILTYKIRSKTFNFQMPTIAYEALAQCADFMKRTAKILSEADREQDRMEIEERLQNQLTLDQCTWADIKKKKVKTLLLSAFIEEMSTINKLNYKEKEYFKMIMSVGFSLGYLNKDDIVFTNGQITNIRGLCFDLAKKKFYIDPARTPKLKKATKSNVAEPKSKFSFIDLWYDLVSYYCTLAERKRSKKDNIVTNGIRLHIIDSSPDNSISITLPTTASGIVNFNTAVTID